MTRTAPTGTALELMSAGRFAEAVSVYDHVLLAGPLQAEAFHNRGYALERLGQLPLALGNYARAITLQPDFAEAYCNRGNVLFSQKRYDLALADYDTAIRLRPDYAAPRNNKGNLLVTLKRYTEAIDELNGLLIMHPDYAEGHNNLGFAHQKLGRHAEALACFERSLALQPDYAEAHNNRGHSLHKLRRFDDALASFERAMALRPNYFDAMWNRGLVRLLTGQMPEGWHDIESRWRREGYQSYPAPRDSLPWQGEDLSGQSIAVFVEQGYGDMFMLCRYLLTLIEAGADVTFAAPRVIHRLLSTLSPKLRLQHTVHAGDPARYHCTLFSLPAVMGTRLETIPVTVPYLAAEPALVEAWRARIGTHGLRVAISWQGNPAGDVDIGRSLPLAALAPLAKVPGVRLISIQHQHGLDQLKQLPEGMVVETLDNFNTGEDGFVDTAAVMQCVDLVITTDSAPAHLAGALGVPVWTLLMEVPDWRWLMDRDDSPWYPNMRLFRQQTAYGWGAVVQQLATELTRMAAGAGTRAGQSQ
jgi:Tfp pilus assembly protein PilF